MRVIESILLFIEGPLLWIVSLIFIIGIVIRAAFFIIATLKGNESAYYRRKPQTILLNFARVFFPFHKAFFKKPVYTTLRYIFHLCLIVVPIWFSGHLYLWEESRFEWYQTAMPDNWADGMTLLLFGICIYFIVRRIIVREIRQNSSVSDYLLIIIAALPFLTGYFFTHGNLDHFVFFDNYLLSIHILSGEVMLLTVVFLFCTARLHSKKCVGCAACAENCPTGTLEAEDADKSRIFKYAHYQCISCGSCVNVCPENAAELRHAINPAYFIQVFSKNNLKTIDLAACKHCGVSYVPEKQLAKINRQLIEKEIECTLTGYCGRCKKWLSKRRYARRKGVI